jgi:hypothetical protein
MLLTTDKLSSNRRWSIVHVFEVTTSMRAHHLRRRRMHHACRRNPHDTRISLHSAESRIVMLRSPANSSLGAATQV